MPEKYDQLVAHLTDLHNLNMTYWILQWDQQVLMPPGGSEARAAQMATISSLRHQMLTSDKTARLIEDAAREVEGAPFDSDQASMIRVARRDHEEALKLPAEYVARFTHAKNMAQDVWVRARANNDFKSFQPTLEGLVDLKIEEANLRGYTDHPYDALLNSFEPGMSTAQVKAIFDGHKPDLVALIAAIGQHEDRVDDSLLHQEFDLDKQRQFALQIAQAFGFDFTRGRLDISVHPFEIQFSRDDVRLTTRYQRDFLNPALFGAMHEAGHGMHGQGFGQSIEGTFLSDLEISSAAVAESQSRTWENIVGRSKPFWQWALPELKKAFPGQFDGVDLDTFYKSINKVRRQFIRVEADEATYNLHIMLRFELETELLTGKVKVADLPREWNTRFEALFGIVPPSDTLGVLQDIHWSMGGFGYFPSYALGNLLSVQYFTRALQDESDIPDQIAAGNFDTLRQWLVEHIYQHGRKFTVDELTRRVTGEGIQSKSYVAYLQAKFSDIYGL
jgi:carboxypeptidase Taq